jgi:hypothetical protein
MQTLTRAEKSAWKLADEEGNIDIDKATKFAKQKHRTRNQVIALLLAVSACLIGIGAMATMLGKQIAKGNVDVQNSIEKAAVTDVALDESGTPHLTFKNSGEDVTIRSTGDRFSTLGTIEANSGRKLSCLPITDVAKMVNDLSSGTPASIAFKNEAGLEDAIIPLTGEFHDEDDIMIFASGKFVVSMESDRCNAAFDGSADTTVEVMNGQDPDKLEKVVDENEGGEGNLFKRKLRNPTVPKTSRSTMTTTSSYTSHVLARHREEYTKARRAIQKGRHLSTSLFVEVEMESHSGTDELSLFGCRKVNKSCNWFRKCCSGLSCKNSKCEEKPTPPTPLPTPPPTTPAPTNKPTKSSFVNNLPCAEDTAGIADVIQFLDDAMEELTGSSLNDLEAEDGEAISIGGWIKDSLTETLEENIPDHIEILVPQKVCSGVGDNLPTRAGDVASCKKLDMLNDTDVLAFGYYDSKAKKGLCGAFNDGTLTFALGQKGLLPPIKVQALTITIDAVAVSIQKELSKKTLNEMWDGTADPVQLNLPGHFVLRGTGNYGIKISEAVTVAIGCDATVLVDVDYANNGFGPVNGAVDYALLLSGRFTPVINIKSKDKNNNGKTDSINLSSVFQVDADLYNYVNGDWISLQLALSRNLYLTELCDVNDVFKVFCVMFKEATFQFAVRSYANPTGFGIQFAFEATIEFKNGFDIVEDLIGWPDDNHVSASLDLRLVNEKLKACVEWEGKEFCTGKCEDDSDCDQEDANGVRTHACDNVFKVCREKRNNGGKCGRDAGCKSNACVSGFCRECPTVGSSVGCDAATEFCQRNDGTQWHVCRPRKSNGQTCTTDNTCSSGHCVSGFCRQCPTVGSSTGCSSSQFCQRFDRGEWHVCRPRKSNGETCTTDNTCSSGHCVSGFCRQCPTPGTSTGCPSRQRCIAATIDIPPQFNVCRYPQSNGAICSTGADCSSGYCVSKICRQCPTPGTSTGCPSGQTCIAATIDIPPQFNVCKPPQSNGAICSTGADCKSGICVSGVGGVKYCRICTSNSHCTQYYGNRARCRDNATTGWIKKCCKSSTSLTCRS